MDFTRSDGYIGHDHAPLHKPPERASRFVLRQLAPRLALATVWTGPITIGGHSFIMDFDTGSSDLWVPGSGCTSSACSTKHKYNPSASSTSTAVPSKTLNVQYGDNSSSSGPVYQDTVAVAGLTATKQTFGAASTLSSSFASSPEDGLVGLTFQSISQLETSPLFMTLISQGKVAAPAFSIKLASSGSELYLGGMNSAKYVSGIDDMASQLGLLNLARAAPIRPFEAAPRRWVVKRLLRACGEGTAPRDGTSTRSREQGSFEDRAIEPVANAASSSGYSR
ncbi:hypothetical protein JCM10212_000484 [Sporobolomyces blumeae]